MRTFEARAERYATMEREVRAAHRLVQVRHDGEDAGPVVFGYGSTFGTPYEVEDWLGTYTEEFTAGAFTKTLAERDDVRLLVQHDPATVLGRTSSGTLSLKQDEVGLYYESTPLRMDDPDVQRLIPKMDRGDLTDSSIAFRVMRQEWNEDWTRRWIREAKLFDTSIVTYPANPNAWSGMREEDLIAQLADLDVEDLALALRSGTARITRSQISSAMGVLDRLLLRDLGDADPAIPPESEEPEEAERDTASTMTLEKARRELELTTLGRTR